MSASMSTPRIFVSHSSKDNAFGQQLAADLRSAFGDDAVWYDASGYLSPGNGLRGGDKWWPLIVSEITNRDTFIVILSPDAVSPISDAADSNVDGWVMDEFDMAWALKKKIGKRIIPILYRPCEPRADILMLQRVDFTSKPYEQALSELLISILPTPPEQEGKPEPAGQLVDRVAQPTPIPETPSIPLDEGTEQMIRDIHAAFGMGDWKEVIERSNLLVRDSPTAMSFALWREYGIAYVENGDGEEALTALNHALAPEEHKHDVFALRGKGLALRLVGREQEASKVQEEAFTRASYKDVPLRLMLLDELVQTLRRIRQWDDAQQRIDQALSLSLPLSQDQHNWLRVKLDTFVEAGHESDAFVLANGLAPTWPELIGHWAQQRFDDYQQTAKWSSAFESIEVALATRLDDSTWLRRKLDVLVHMEQEAQARALARESASRFPIMVDGWLQDRYQDHLRAENWPAALVVIEVALDVRRDDPVWLRRKLDTLTQAGREPEALAQARQWATTYPTVVNNWLQDRFQAYWDNKNWPAAQVIIDQGLSSGVDNASWLTHQRDELLQTKKTREALSVARKLTELPSANADVWLAVIIIASTLQQMREVRVALDRYGAYTSGDEFKQARKQYYEPLEKASRRNWTLLFVLASVIVLACVSIAALNVTGSGSAIGSEYGSVLADPMIAASMFIWLLAFVSGVVLTLWAIARTVRFEQSGWWTALLIVLGLLLSWAVPFLGPFLYFMYGPGPHPSQRLRSHASHKMASAKPDTGSVYVRPKREPRPNPTPSTSGPPKRSTNLPRPQPSNPVTMPKYTTGSRPSERPPKSAAQAKQAEQTSQSPVKPMPQSAPARNNSAGQTVRDITKREDNPFSGL